ncbi:hypothetical protein pb186bvf_003465 [Paramecium bursaria]
MILYKLKYIYNAKILIFKIHVNSFNNFQTYSFKSNVKVKIQSKYYHCSKGLQNCYSICNHCKFCTEEDDKTGDKLQIYILSEVEQLVHFRCKALDKIIGDDTIQFEDLIYYIYNHVTQSFSLQIKMFMRSQENNVFNKIQPKESTQINFFIIIRNLNKRVHKQFIILSEFLEQLLIDALNKFLLEGDQFIDEWLDNKIDVLNQQWPDLVVVDAF